MNDTSAARTSGSAPRGQRAARTGHSVKGGTSLANRLAVAILEVLAGVRTPGQAAAALAISLPRYYQLETRALEGLVSACEPKSKGKQPSPHTRIKVLEKQIQDLQRDCTRQQSLARVAQRSVGLSAPPAANAKSKAKGPATSGSAKSSAPSSAGSAGTSAGAARRRKRRPTVRALRAAQVLAKKIRPDDSEAVQQSESAASESMSTQVEETVLIETGGDSAPEAASVNGAGRTPAVSVDSQDLPGESPSLNKDPVRTDSLSGRAHQHGGT